LAGRIGDSFVLFERKTEAKKLKKNNKTNTDLYPTTNPHLNRMFGSFHKVWCKKGEPN